MVVCTGEWWLRGKEQKEFEAGICGLCDGLGVEGDR